jgi:hypothetical protein
MAVTVKNLIPAKELEIAQTTQYTANNVKAVIDKATITNTSANNQTFSVNIALGAVGDDNLIIDNRTVLPGETYLCPELIGQVIENTGIISTIASTVNTLTLAVSGREIS